MLQIDALFLKNITDFFESGVLTIYPIFGLGIPINSSSHLKLCSRNDLIIVWFIFVIPDLLKVHFNLSIPHVFFMFGRWMDKFRKFVQPHSFSSLAKYKQQWFDQVWFSWAIWSDDSWEAFVEGTNFFSTVIWLEIFKYYFFDHQSSVSFGDLLTY